MRYAVLSGGKRIRPILALEACRAVGGRIQDALPAACALELIHSYSLVHDDLPCMDDDQERRGQPTCHVRFGESTALLAGDALLTLAFKILCSPNGKAASRQLEAGCFIAEAVGANGMVGGQAADLEFQPGNRDLPTIESINIRKSGALIAASIRAGAYLGGGRSSEVEALYRYGKAIGLLFQIVDDILDGQGYAKVIGISEARNQASALLAKAKKEIKPLGSRGQTLMALAEFVHDRRN